PIGLEPTDGFADRHHRGVEFERDLGEHEFVPGLVGLVGHAFADPPVGRLRLAQRGRPVCPIGGRRRGVGCHCEVFQSSNFVFHSPLGGKRPSMGWPAATCSATQPSSVSLAWAAWTTSSTRSWWITLAPSSYSSITSHGMNIEQSHNTCNNSYNVQDT